jgi:outer membrane protein assembly factor BamB
LINGGSYGGVYAFHAGTGQEIWFNSLTQYDKWTPAAYENVVYTFTGGSNYGLLKAININTGLTIWEKNDILYNWSGYTMNTAPVIDAENNVIYVTSESYLHAVDLSTQEILWYKSGDFGITPACGLENLYVINNGYLEAYNKLTGQFLWSFQDLSGIISPPVVTEDHVIVASETMVKIVKMEDQQVVWDYNEGGKIAYGNGNLLVASPAGTLYCFDTDTISAVTSNGQQNYFTIYPNPASTRVNVEYCFDFSAEMRISILDLFGNEVISASYPPTAKGIQMKTIDVSALHKGTYFIYLSQGGKQYFEKLIIY